MQDFRFVTLPALCGTQRGGLTILPWKEAIPGLLLMALVALMLLLFRLP